jgi:hypothetical protein
MFRSFDGTWSIRTHSRYEEVDPATGTLVYKYNTKLTYSVFVAPKGKKVMIMMVIMTDTMMMMIAMTKTTIILLIIMMMILLMLVAVVMTIA